MTKGLASKSGKKCQLSGKKAMKGWRYSFLRSHYNPTAKRRFEVNLQTIHTTDENGTPITIKVATSVLKRCPEIKAEGIGAYKKRKKTKRISRKERQELIDELTAIQKAA